MTKLLVSVRNAAEAELAIAGGADFIDVKEPDRGPLGRADFGVIAEVVDCIGGRAPVSAALGELVDWRVGDVASLPQGLNYVKFGLEGCGLLPAWRECWRQTLESLSLRASVVPVAYADHHAAAAPHWEEVIDVAAQFGADAVLLDTFDKDGPGLLAVCESPELQAFVARAKSVGLMAIVAGKLDPAAVEQVLLWQPDVIGVRGAACVGGRTGRLDTEAVRRLSKLLESGRLAKPVRH